MGKNRECRACGQKFHHCGQCGGNDWEGDFCCFYCLEQYREKKIAEYAKDFNIPEKIVRDILNTIQSDYLYF